MRLSFHGGVEGVTGSCFLIQNSKSKLLIDCGLFQEERFCGKQNFAPFGFEPKEIDAVIITHAHVDHIGRLPLLIKSGFKGLIYLTEPTQLLMKILLEDSLQMMTENAQRCDDDLLFSNADIEATLARCRAVNYHTQILPAAGFAASFFDAGHILGSAFIKVDNEETRSSICFSGDLGNISTPILPDTEKIDRTDFAVVESTYGDRDHESRKERIEKLITFINLVIGRGGTVIIPAFSVERTQELLYELDLLLDEKKIPKVTYYLDSPLSIKATEIYQRFKNFLRFDRSPALSQDGNFFDFPYLQPTLSVDASKMINDDHKPKVIIAGSGMMTGGRILHHLKRYLPDEKSGVLIIGHQADGTLGRKIFDHESPVTIHGEKYAVRASVEAIGAFSAHADRQKLTNWLQPKEGQIQKIFLVHGDAATKANFKTFLEGQLQAEIIVPKLHEAIQL